MSPFAEITRARGAKTARGAAPRAPRDIFGQKKEGHALRKDIP